MGKKSDFKKTMVKKGKLDGIRAITKDQEWFKTDQPERYEQTTFDKTAPLKIEGIHLNPTPKHKDLIFAGEILEEDTTTPRLAKEVAENHKDRTIGRNKSGCLWKKGNSTQSLGTKKSLNNKSWEKRVIERQQKKVLQGRLTELREKRAEAKRKSSKNFRDKVERKKVNEMRSAKYQIIKNMAKTKKWTKKAKATLTKLPAEIFYEKFK